MSSTSSDSKQTPVKRHARGRRVGLVVVCLLLAGILLFAMFAGAESRWHCSPSQPRRNGTRAWEIATSLAQVTEEPNEDLFASFIVTSDEESFRIQHTAAHPPDNPFDYEVQKMTSGETVNIGPGTLTLCAIGTAYLDAAQTMEDDAAHRFYDAELRSMTAEQAKELGNFEFVEPGRNFRYAPLPRVKLGFRHEGIDDLMFHGIAVFDASTKENLTGGYGSSGSQAHHWFDTQIPLWHRTPVDVVIEVSYGPSKTFEFAPRAGKGFREGNFECRLVGVLEGVDNYGHRSTQRESTVTHTFPKAPPDKAGVRFVFACQPAAGKMPVTLEFLGADGNVLPGRGSSTSGYTHTPALAQPLEKVARVRARYRTQRQRILIHLPYIPGLPDQNSTVDDLFDVHIPYVRLHDADQVGYFLRRTLQLQMSRQTGPVPSNSINSVRFPLEFSDATVREIARLYAEGGDLEVDIENEQLRVQYPVPLRMRLRQFLQVIYPRK